jgi:hypothetical protein
MGMNYVYLKGTPIGNNRVCPPVANGVLKRTKLACDNCNEYGKIKDGQRNTVYAVYTYGKGYLCSACALRKKVI